MDNAWRKYAETAAGLTKMTRQAAEAAVRQLVRQGEVAADAAERSVEELLRRSERNREAVAAIARGEVERTVDKLGLARQTSVDQLTEQVAGLAAQVASLEGRLKAGAIPQPPAAQPKSAPKPAGGRTSKAATGKPKPAPKPKPKSSAAAEPKPPSRPRAARRDQLGEGAP